MSPRIFKYPLDLIDQDQAVSVSADARLVLAAVQRGHPTLWFEIDEQADVSEPRWFLVILTGGHVPEDTVHVGSMVDGNTYV